MRDPHVLHDTHAAGTPAADGAPPAAAASAARHDAWVRPVLWLLLLLAAAGNVVANSAGLLAMSIPLGLAVLTLAAALVAHHRRTHA